MINYKFDIELLGDRTIYTNAVFTSGDTYAYRLSFSFFENKKPFDASSYTLCIKAKRSDGAIISDIGPIDSGNVYYDVKNSMIAQSGEVSFEIALCGTDGSYITTKELIANVREGYGDESVRAETAAPILSSLIAAANTSKTYAKSAMENAESANQAAESANQAAENFSILAEDKIAEITENSLTAIDSIKDTFEKAAKYYEKSGAIPSDENYFQFTLDDKTKTAVCKYQLIGTSHAVIPYSYMGYTVTELSEIGAEESENHTLTLPVTIEKINGYTITNFIKLTELSIPNGVKSIGEFSIYNCPVLKKVSLPDTLLSIGESAFSNCPSLEKIHIPDSVTLIKDGAFSGGNVTFICSKGSVAESFALSNSIPYEYSSVSPDILGSGESISAAIGDIEASLDNIITKYGLGGDNQ